MNDIAARGTEAALVRLLASLEGEAYDFVAPTPLTHARLLARWRGRTARTLREALGWSLPFRPGDLPPNIVQLMQSAGVVERDGGLMRSTVRVSRVRGLLFLHSAYPTEAMDAVFLGPDSYRFADFLAAELGARGWVGRLADIGGGAGVGALTAAAGRGRADLLLTDINPKALRLARANAAHAGVALQTRETGDVTILPEGFDLILANPPYIAEADQTYQAGGGLHGGQASLDWATAALPKLAPGGRLLLYTGSAILEGGHDQLKAQLQKIGDAAGARLSYRELDPDVFGEELERPAYRDVERIAAVGATFTRPRDGGGGLRS